MKERTRFKKRREILKYRKRLCAIFGHPLFWILTVGGNGMILCGAALLSHLESDGAPTLEFVDFLLWSTGLVTTIGYGNYTPHSFNGKLTVVGLMLFGTLFVWSYMGFFVTALISPALSSLEKEVQDVEKELSELKTEETRSHTK